MSDIFNLKNLAFLLFIFIETDIKGQALNQNKVIYTKPQIVKYFDIDTFNKYQKAGVANYTLADGTNVTAKIIGDGYYEYKSKPGSPYHMTCDYYTNLALKRCIFGFYGVLCAGSNDYDEHLNILKSWDLDANFKFKIEDLVNKILKKYHIDLMVYDNKINVWRYLIKNKPVYQIVLPTTSGKSRRILMNGNNGHLISDKPLNIIDD